MASPTFTHPAAPLLEHHPDPALVADAQGDITWMNAAARAWLGDTVPTLAALGIDGNNGESAAFEGRVGPADGQRRWCRIALGAPAEGLRLVTLAPTPAERGVSSAQMAAAVELGHIAIWRHDIPGRRVHLNDEGCRILGLTQNPEGLPVCDVLARVHRDDLEVARASVARSLASDRPVDFEIRIRAADGSWRHLLTRRVAERGADGQPVSASGVSLDVTGPREDARRAQEMMRRFDLVASTAGIGHWSAEVGSEQPRWSAQLYAMHGLDPDVLPPPTREWLKQYVHEQDREALAQTMRDWTQSGRPAADAEFRLVRPDGAIVHVVTHSRIETANGRPIVFGIVIDVTERRQAEAALRQAAERAALIANGVGLGTWWLDLDSDHAVWDEQMWRLRGLPPQPQAMSNEERLAIVHPDDRERAARIHVDPGRSAEPINHEFRVHWPDGSWHWLASRSIAVCGPDGRPVSRIGVNWDVTEARSAAVERQERVAAQREVQAKSQFLSRMSHELRTPLNAVLGFTQLLLSENTSADADVRARRLDHIQSAGQHLLALIDDVLDLSRLEGGEMQIALEPVALPPIVAEVVAQVEPLAQRHGVRLEVGTLDATPLADPTRLRQVLLNLLTNAIKYNRAGGHVQVQASQGRDVVMLSVSDTGQGMTPRQLGHLFEPFNRLGAEATGVEGTGIGLAIAKALIERMGGTVAVESSIGQGSRFELRLLDGGHALPAVGELASPQTMALAATAGRVGRGGRVLYIEDNPVNTLIVGELIAQRPDLTLLTAPTGLEGLAIARAQRPDLILLDMQLPDINGPEVFRRLQAEPRTARIPCIALSANAMQADIDDAMRAGFADYWTKPLDFRTFTTSMDAMFGPAPPAPAADSDADQGTSARNR